MISKHPLDSSVDLTIDLKSDLARAILPIVIENLQLLDQKQQDYGSRNLLRFGVPGVVVRMSDKMERIITLTDLHQIKPGSSNFEPLSDSFLDISNYGLIAAVMQRGLWPTKKD